MHFTNFKNSVILWDMDGVLIDSLGLDLKVINPILEKEFGVKNGISKDFLKSIFAYAVPDFCKMILEKVSQYSEENLNKFIVQFEEFRRNAKFDLLPNVAESLEKFKSQDAVQYVVSNNKEEDIKRILKNCGIYKYFKGIIGYDSFGKIAKKPAPDIYIHACRNVALQRLYKNIKLKMKDWEILIIEDSCVGVRAGVEARKELRIKNKELRIKVVGVATGADSFENLEKEGADEVLENLKCKIKN
jgi:beta-phosphoglucomutase-like phosphatase (HAD superfamily)